MQANPMTRSHAHHFSIDFFTSANQSIRAVVSSAPDMYELFGTFKDSSVLAK